MYHRILINRINYRKNSFLMWFSIPGLQNHYLRNDGFGKEPEPDRPTPEGPEPEKTFKKKS